MITHESYIAKIAELAIARLDNPEERQALRAIKLTYGAGPDGVRGITYYKRWTATGSQEPVPFVGINGMCQESPVQLAGTTIHELGHVLAPIGAGHDKQWHNACAKLGLVNLQAAGTAYDFDKHFDPKLAKAIQKLKTPDDGQPVCQLGNLAGQPAMPGSFGAYLKLKPCTAGYGTRGGKSRGAGSGSRLLKYACDGIGHAPTIVRASAGANLNATCNHCQTLFHLA